MEKEFREVYPEYADILDGKVKGDMLKASEYWSIFLMGCVRTKKVYDAYMYSPKSQFYLL